MRNQVRAFFMAHYPNIPASAALCQDKYPPHLQDINNQMPAGVEVIADYGINFEACTGDTAIMLERTSVAVTKEGNMLMLYYGDCGIEIQYSVPYMQEVG